MRPKPGPYEPCAFCSEEPPAGPFSPLEQHTECALRAIVGGIGHLLNHNHWCLTVGDPDGGYPYRESAILVAGWVNDQGNETTDHVRKALGDG
jgi:hypothetical protein